MYTIIRGERRPDDGLKVALPGAGWEYAQRGRCPDCGGIWLWSEAGYAPGTRKCFGFPVEEINPIFDRRVPGPDGLEELLEPFDTATLGMVRALYKRRNACPEEEVRSIDAEILAHLSQYCEPPDLIRWDAGGGCGSIFRVGGTADGWFLTRERFLGASELI